MTDSHVVKGGKTVRKLEVGELIETLEEPKKEENINIIRVKARAEKDGKEGFISVCGNQGTVYMEPHSAYDGQRLSVDKALREVSDVAKETLKYIDDKVDELKAVRSGPLATTKTDLANMKPKVKAAQQRVETLRTEFQGAVKQLADAMEVEKQKRQDAADRKVATAVHEEVAAVVSKLEEDFERVFPRAEAISKNAGADETDPLSALNEAEKALKELIESSEKAIALIKHKVEEVKPTAKGPLGELRASLVKTKVSVTTMENKSKKQITSLVKARGQVAEDAHKAIVDFLVQNARKSEGGADKLIKQLCGDQEIVPLATAKGVIESLPEAKFKVGQLDLGLERYSEGFAKVTVLDMVQEHMKCVKEIAVTTDFDVKDSKTIRKLAAGETVEILEASAIDSSVGLSRVKCRALSDAVTGWVTLRGNQGTPFLEKGSKPYACCEQEVPLNSCFETNSEELRKIRPGEVFELIEGPRKEPPQPIQRVRGKAKKDGKVGYVTVEDSSGANLELTSLMSCKQSIAITSTFSISQGKAIRKLAVGETLETLEPEKLDEERSLFRIKARATLDGQEGYVTVKGNQGTAFVEPDKYLYICKSAVPIEARAVAGSATVRMLEEGELFEAADSPTKDTKDGPNRAKGRSVSDGTEGWFTVGGKKMTPWSPTCKCTVSTSLQDGLGIADSKLLRKLEPGELLQALSTPVKEATTNLLRVRVLAHKDGKVGYASTRSTQGSLLLVPASSVAASEAKAAAAVETSAAKPATSGGKTPPRPATSAPPAPPRKPASTGPSRGPPAAPPRPPPPGAGKGGAGKGKYKR
eukprot:TRINITY_DN2862_c0_g2_i1.p1 TRINITY_DN2862_c0_g2~~TRINITY_DN2862_c0_g2_i1.p1  ORF type:complete len:884 (-),score=211.54 TRINITY_DN2862_c0_g2_i1:94-2532(-)